MSCDGDLIAGASGTWKLLFYDKDRQLADPPSILVVHRQPDGTETSYTEADAEVFQDTPAATGIWFFTSPALAAGKHLIYYRGGGAAERITFTVGPDGTTTV